MTDPAHVHELRTLVEDCVRALRTAQPHIAMQPVRLALEAVAARAEQALNGAEAETGVGA